MESNNYDVIVIGAGPSGSIASCIMAKQGLRVLVLEKEIFPRYVVGESLLPLSMHQFEECGMLEAIAKANFVKKYGAVFEKDNKRVFFDFSKQYVKDGWTWTYQAERAELDKIMADAASNAGVEIRYQHLVKDVEMFGTHCKVMAQGPQGEFKAEAKFLIDASGYGRFMPDKLSHEKPSSLPNRCTSFVLINENNRPKDRSGDDISFYVTEQNLWFWLIPLKYPVTSIGFVGDLEHFTPYDKNGEIDLRAMISLEPRAAKRIGDSEFQFSPVTMKSYSKSVKALYGEGYCLVGNSSEFLDPIFSSGVAVCTAAASLAGKLVCRQLKGEKVDWQKEYADHLSWGVDVFRSYVNAWYDGSLQTVFFSELENSDFREKITSVLAGYVWDMSNPFVAKHKTIIQTLAQTINMTNKIDASVV